MFFVSKIVLTKVFNHYLFTVLVISKNSNRNFQFYWNIFNYSWIIPIGFPISKMKGCFRKLRIVDFTDKRTDIWSRNFMIREINFGLWADAWAGPWEKGVWADSEQLFWVVFSIFNGQKKFFFNFFLHFSVRTEKLHKIKFSFWKKILS